MGRFVVINTLLAYAPERAPEALRHYARMKCESDDYLIASGLDYLVLRPGTFSPLARGKLPALLLSVTVPPAAPVACAANALPVRPNMNAAARAEATAIRLLLCAFMAYLLTSALERLERGERAYALQFACHAL
ncbi:NAD(P)H-binding protein [Paraburkholderia sp. GAS334]|uniref:NAD(P)H-binding protein n=1 Tax=Paraburkholderia sp. GAS334 TaxID=3035131 RepID=UPI003D25A0DF